MVTPRWAINALLSLLRRSTMTLPFPLVGYCFYRQHGIALAVETLYSKTFCNYILWPLTLENQNGFTAAIIL